MKTKAITTQEKNITDKVLIRVKEMEETGNLNLPKNYSYQNALKSAYLILSETVDRNKQPVLTSCSKESICNALLDMVIQGLSPVKKQCYFIPFSGKLQLMKSYLGNIASTKRLNGVKDIFANVIYKDDDFEYKIDLETGLKVINKHEQKLENIDLNKIIGAYAVITKEDGRNFVEVMTMDQIRKAWNQGLTKGSSGAHKNFADEMAKKTVINRACKIFVNTSDDSDLLIESINRTNEYKEENIIEATHEEVKEEIKEEANKELIDLEENELENLENEDNQDIIDIEENETEEIIEEDNIEIIEENEDDENAPY